MKTKREFEFNVEPLCEVTSAKKRTMTSRLHALAVTCGVVFIGYLMLFAVIPGEIANKQGNVTDMLKGLVAYLIGGTGLVLLSLSMFSSKQKARWMIKPL